MKEGICKVKVVFKSKRPTTEICRIEEIFGLMQIFHDPTADDAN